MDSGPATVVLTAVACSGLFEGTAAFLSLGDPVPYYKDDKQSAKELLRDWRRMFPPAMAMQSRLVALSAAFTGVPAWSLWDSNPSAAAAFGVAAAVNVAIVGYTFSKIMPLNNRLLPEGEVEKVESDDGVRSMLQQWGKMHSVRTLLGAAALGATLYGAHACLTSK